ncbi:hypothetical protein F0562_008889 [Nyssa sinensis]|uniref:Uncharacterized protein n=1 Tax=Nyssa sinensis TaxID=561372 RepID=A0A5J5AAG9_9ASTE|nr:hypothetical protein F0562_008889 [Nyssa sinensis]
MATIKKRGRTRSKSFLCFRPVAIEDGLVKRIRTDDSGDPVETCVDVGGKEEDMLIPKIWKCLSHENLKVSDGDVATDERRPKKRSHRIFSRILKAVLFDTSLAKKNSKRKVGNNSQSDLSAINNKIETSMDEKNIEKKWSDADEDCRMNSGRSSSPYTSSVTPSTSLCSSCASSITSNSRSLSESKRSFRANQIELKQLHRNTTTVKVGGYFGSNVGLCLLLICLFVLIFWGRLCAIICTSTWLFVAPNRSNRVVSAEKGVDWSEVDSEEHKKRVIMEGLLERNRSRIQSLAFASE